jgi:hypothetical protein
MNNVITIILLLLWFVPLMFCHLEVFPKYYDDMKSSLLNDSQKLDSKRSMEYYAILSMLISTISFVILMCFI